MRLEELEQSQQEWLIDEFVEIANQLLPQYLPETKGNTKVKEEINPRLVRHYTTLKLMDEPTRQNRYAVYNYRQLLQFLLVRRLLSEGISAAAISDLLTSKSNQELKNLLTGGISIQITTTHPTLTQPQFTNPALEYLASLKKGKYNQSSLPEKSPVYPNILSDNILDKNYDQKLSKSKSILETEWTRIEVLEGLELNIRSDFIYPNSISEQESLNQRIIQTLTQILTRKKP
jgi:DNA-binding transcriptional MerR regulator